MDAIANAARLMNSPGAPKCPGWDPDDPAGCWTHDGPTDEGVDYCDGFRLFERYEEAKEYGAGLGSKVTFNLGFDLEANMWVVTPLNGTYGS